MRGSPACHTATDSEVWEDQDLRTKLMICVRLAFAVVALLGFASGWSGRALADHPEIGPELAQKLTLEALTRAPPRPVPHYYRAYAPRYTYVPHYARVHEYAARAVRYAPRYTRLHPRFETHSHYFVVSERHFHSHLRLHHWHRA